MPARTRRRLALPLLSAAALVLATPASSWGAGPQEGGRDDGSRAPVGAEGGRVHGTALLPAATG